MESKIDLSKVKLSSNETWGADPSFVFEHYRNLPFAPFNKLDKIGRFCDITGISNVSRPSTVTTAATSNIVSSTMADEEEEFKVVETKVLQKTKDIPTIKRRVQFQPHQNKPKPQDHRRHYGHRVQVTKTKFQDNAGIQSDWNYIIDAGKSNFDKTPVSDIKVADLATKGKIPEYDKSWDGKPNPKKNVPFTLPNTLSFGTGPRQDKFLNKLIEEEEDTDNLTIYTTDVILSAILTVKNSVFPWDLTVTKEGNQIFLEPSRKNKVNYIDILTVNENSSSSLPEDEKEMLKACIESTNINKKFIELSTKGTDVKEFKANDAQFVEVPDKKVYRYRRWTLDKKIDVVVRSEIDSFVKDGETSVFTKVCALNEFLPQMDWKQNVELNRGALISAEIRNNLSKICSWLCQAFLAECDQFKMGFVTKPNAKEAKYTVLAVEDMTTKNLSQTINFRIKDSWSIVKTLAEIMNKQDDGTYAFVKQPYKQSIRVYRLPDKDDQSDDN